MQKEEIQSMLSANQSRIVKELNGNNPYKHAAVALLDAENKHLKSLLK